jgi:exodeoxyribonuclease VII large subunit
MSDDKRTPASAGSNLPEYTVGEISGAIKRTLESGFDRVRVRGEISGFKRAASGHLYMALKDADAVLDGVCWRGTAGRLGIKPEDGMEVIAVGRITTYAGRSKYQMVIEAMELAGEGALLKLLEERRLKLAAEGLFAEERKRKLPFLPEVIGVVTSPTGAVIRDILHRLAERFPRHVLVWPVLVQGEGAAEQVAAAIRGFNALPTGGSTPRPDLLIVARGGGSLEDLWAFNEEIVARAAAASEIPLISAVGHETDTTLVDFAADRRAPTPTAAAEMAVPVRGELLTLTLDLGRRLVAAGGRTLAERRERVAGLARGLPDARRLLGERAQQLDDRAERLEIGIKGLLRRQAEQLGGLAARLPHPRQQVERAGLALAERSEQLGTRAVAVLRQGRRDLLGLRPRPPQGILRHATEELRTWSGRLGPAVDRALRDRATDLMGQARVLESVSYQATLKRGFAVVHGPAGLVTSAEQARLARYLEIHFQDGAVPAEVAAREAGFDRGSEARGESGAGGKAGAGGRERADRRKPPRVPGPGKQGSLF